MSSLLRHLPRSIGGDICGSVNERAGGRRKGVAGKRHQKNRRVAGACARLFWHQAGRRHNNESKATALREDTIFQVSSIMNRSVGRRFVTVATMNIGENGAAKSEGENLVTNVGAQATAAVAASLHLTHQTLTPRTPHLAAGRRDRRWRHGGRC